jgi:cysteine synthase
MVSQPKYSEDITCFMASVLDLIGETPLIEITKFDCGPCQLFLKLESANPSGSIKDRPARFMIEAAENDGRLKPGGTIVEATADNTGLGLALVGGRKGYRIVLVVPDKMAREKILQCKAMGAEVALTRSDVGRGHPDYYQDLAEAITAGTPGAHRPARDTIPPRGGARVSSCRDWFYMTLMPLRLLWSSGTQCHQPRCGA